MTNRMRIIIFGVGGTLLVIGFLLTGFWWHLYNAMVLQVLPISNNARSETFKIWTKTSVPLYFSIFLFNWTNAEYSVSRGEKPQLQQLGPYVYRVEVKRENFIWNKNGTVTYTSKQRFYYEPAMSKGDAYSDIVLSPNVIFLTLTGFLHDIPKWVKTAIDKTFKREFHVTFYVKKRVNELLFDGYDDKLLDILKPFKQYLPQLKTLPDRFAWYYTKNRTTVDVYNVHTGEEDLRKLGNLYSRNFSTRNIFEGACGVVQGSTGDFWPVDVAEQKNVSLYISDFCSGFQLDRVGPKTIGGLSGVKFEGRKATFDNGSTYAEKSCYCPKGKCQISSGIRDLTKCLKSPVFISFPHFYAADLSYLDAVKGLNPEADSHSFYMVFQKDYGLLLNGKARLQINMHVKPVSGFQSFEKVPDVYLPALWFEESIDLPQDLTDNLYFSFKTIPMIFSVVALVLVVSGAIILVCGLIFNRMLLEDIPYTNERI